MGFGGVDTGTQYRRDPLLVLRDPAWVGDGTKCAEIYKRCGYKEDEIDTSWIFKNFEGDL